MLGFALSGCGSGTADIGSAPGASKSGTSAAEKVYADLNAKGDGARKAAVAAAKKEGELNLYTSMNEAVANAVAQAFGKQFGIKVNVFRGSSETILQRVLQESQASHPGADVVETNFLEMQTLQHERLLGHFGGTVVRTLPSTAKFDNWTADRFNVFLPAWNTDKVKPGDEPKSWADLADPRWKGRMQIELSDSDWYENLTHYWLTHGKTQQQVDRLW
ncbi:MAG: extracellular solute-binding protein, partial [Sciscionella sp.]